MSIDSRIDAEPDYKRKLMLFQAHYPHLDWQIFWHRFGNGDREIRDWVRREFVGMKNPDGKHKWVSQLEFRQFIETDIPDSAWPKIWKFMQRKGYDWRSPEDAKRGMLSMMSRMDGTINPDIFPDHAEAIKQALKPTIRKPRTEDQKLLTRIKRFFGTTNNYNVAGYILSDGSMLDFSGRKRGAQAGDNRGEDHRLISGLLGKEGYEAIRAFGEQYGAISLHYSNGYTSLRVYKQPTNAQWDRLKDLRRQSEAFQINMYRGRETFDKMYGDKDYSYITDIQRFFP